jgi:hypothetical protein
LVIMSPLQEYSADHRYLLERAAREGGLEDAVAVHVDDFYGPLLKKAKRGEMRPIDGVLIRSWDRASRITHPGLALGLRCYEIDGVKFVRICGYYDTNLQHYALDFFAVGRRDYRKLYRAALRSREAIEPPALPPILSAAQTDQLWKNTVGYLESANLERINQYGGRARRGVLLTGPPGNG